MIKGIVKLFKVDSDKLSSGSEVIVLPDTIYVIGNIAHMNGRGDWAISTIEGVVDVDEENIFEPLVVDLRPASNGNPPYHIKNKEWKKALGLIDQEVEFEIVTLSFIKGPYAHACSRCGGHFDGAKKQKQCKGCCSEQETASFKSETPKEKKKRVRMMGVSRVKSIAREAYFEALGSNDQTEFDHWWEQNEERLCQ